MADIRCPNCKAGIDDQFAHCPWCHEPILMDLDHVTTRRRQLYLLSGMMVGVFLLLWVFLRADPGDAWQQIVDQDQRLHGTYEQR